MKLKFQGITKKPKDELNRIRVKVSLSHDSLKQVNSEYGEFTCDDSGIWTGIVNFKSVVPQEGYKILVKGPKHIQKKICTATPSESSFGNYRCLSGDDLITIYEGSNDFDFSGIYMLAGDLPNQDGVVNSYDTSAVFNKLNKLDYASLTNSDINLDGAVNALDYGIIIQSLTVTDGIDEK